MGPKKTTIQEEFQEAIGTALASSCNPGITAHVAAPGWTVAAAAGMAGLAPPLHAAPGMHFRAGSISKMFTAAAVLRLAEDGRLGLDDPAAKWLGREYTGRMAGAGRTTLRHLLGHRSGIADSGMDFEAVQTAQPETPVRADIAIFAGLDKGPAHAPGEGHVYSNVNYLLLGIVIDAASGTSYEKYLARTIIGPLGLGDTFVMSDPPGRTLPEPYMRCLLFEGGRWTDYSAMYRLFDRAAADIVSTAGDLNAFQRGLREGRIIGAAMLREMEDFLPASERYEYGLGYTRKRGGSMTLLGHERHLPRLLD